MDHISIRPASWENDQELLREIRKVVFIEEQSVPVDLEWDGKDEQAWHWLAFISVNGKDRPVGTCRMLHDGHIGRMAVLAEYRQQGIGQQLLAAALQKAISEQLLEAYLYAQTHALAFYQRAGFTALGEEFMDAGIPHRTMRKPIADKRIKGLHAGDFSIQDFRSAAQDLIQQTEQDLRILSVQLDPDVFDNTEITDCISALARKSRYTQIRLLVLESRQLSARGHRLLNLHRRLSSKIALRCSNTPAHDIKESLIIADQSAFIAQSIRDPDKCWGNYNNKPVAQSYIEYFDQLWEHATEDKNLRQLEI